MSRPHRFPSGNVVDLDEVAAVVIDRDAETFVMPRYEEPTGGWRERERRRQLRYRRPAMGGMSSTPVYVVLRSTTAAPIVDGSAHPLRVLVDVARYNYAGDADHPAHGVLAEDLAEEVARLVWPP